MKIYFYFRLSNNFTPEISGKRDIIFDKYNYLNQHIWYVFLVLENY